MGKSQFKKLFLSEMEGKWPEYLLYAAKKLCLNSFLALATSNYSLINFILISRFFFLVDSAMLF